MAKENFEGIEGFEGKRINEEVVIDQINKDKAERDFEFEAGKQNNDAAIEKVYSEAIELAGRNADKISPKPLDPELIIEDEPIVHEKSTFKRAGGLKKLALWAGMLFGAASATAKDTGPKKPLPDSVKNKTETGIKSIEQVNDQLRKDWNKYVDWLESINMKGNPALDKNDLGGAMVDRYKKEHPETSVSRETIDDIQQEFVKYRQWSLAEIKAGRASFAPGTNEDNFMRALSIVDGIPGQRTTSFKFPSTYLVTFENKGLNTNKIGTEAIQTKLTSEIKNVQGELRATNIKNEGFAKVKDTKTSTGVEIAKNK